MAPSLRRSSRNTSSSLASRVEKRTKRRQPKTPAQPTPVASQTISRHGRRKKPTWPFLRRSPATIAADPNRSTILFSLPIELIHEIASHLPAGSEVCLTLTCKEAANVLGTDSWSDESVRKRWGPSRKAMLEALVRDGIGESDYCPRCDTLHPPLPPPRSHRPTKLTTYCFGQDASMDYLPCDETHGYSLLFPHIREAMEAPASQGNPRAEIELLSGDFAATRAGVKQRVVSSGCRVQGNLILSHTYTFESAQSRKPLCARDILDLPLRLCPHQSTTTSSSKPSRFLKDQPNSVLLTYAIRNAFPEPLRGAFKPDVFKKPVPSEQAQMAATGDGEPVAWRCRSCPTKFQLDHEGDALVIKTWHCFGADLYHAQKYWKWLVRREGQMLGPDKRNDEWWSPSRTVPNFKH